MIEYHYIYNPKETVVKLALSSSEYIKIFEREYSPFEMYCLSPFNFEINCSESLNKYPDITFQGTFDIYINNTLDSSNLDINNLLIKYNNKHPLLYIEKINDTYLIHNQSITEKLLLKVVPKDYSYVNSNTYKNKSINIIKNSLNVCFSPSYCSLSLHDLNTTKYINIEPDTKVTLAYKGKEIKDTDFKTLLSTHGKNKDNEIEVGLIPFMPILYIPQYDDSISNNFPRNVVWKVLARISSGEISKDSLGIIQNTSDDLEIFIPSFSEIESACLPNNAQYVSLQLENIVKDTNVPQKENNTFPFKVKFKDDINQREFVHFLSDTDIQLKSVNNEIEFDISYRKKDSFSIKSKNIQKIDLTDQKFVFYLYEPNIDVQSKQTYSIDIPQQGTLIKEDNTTSPLFILGKSILNDKDKYVTLKCSDLSFEYDENNILTDIETILFSSFSKFEIRLDDFPKLNKIDFTDCDSFPESFSLDYSDTLSTVLFSDNIELLPCTFNNLPNLNKEFLLPSSLEYFDFGLFENTSVEKFICYGQNLLNLTSSIDVEEAVPLFVTEHLYDNIKNSTTIPYEVKQLVYKIEE